MRLSTVTFALASMFFASQGFATPPPGTPPVNLTTTSFVGGNVVKGDAFWGLINCVVDGTRTVTCPAPAAFSLTGTYSGMLVADDVGPGRAVFTSTILSATPITGGTGGVSIVMNSTPSFSNANVLHVGQLDVVPGSGGSGYAFGSIQTLNCSSCATGDVAATGTPSEMAAVSASTGSMNLGANSGHADGMCSTLKSTTQVGIGGDTSTFAGMILGGKLVMNSVITVVHAGTIAKDFTPFGSGVYYDTMSGCGFPVATQPRVKIVYGVTDEQINPGTGIYAEVSPALPPCDVTGGVSVSSNDGATGLMLSCTNTGELYKGTVSFGTDNTLALQAAISSTAVGPPTAMNVAAANGQPECLYLPAGNYLTQPLNQYSNPAMAASGPNVAQGYGCWLGDEHFHTNIFVIPNFKGDVFAWNASNSGGSLVPLGNTQWFANATGTGNHAGSAFRNITIIGNRLSTVNQNALVFYGKTQFAFIDNVVVNYIKGRAFFGGAADASGSGDFAESVIDNTRFEVDGYGPTVPTVEITSNGAVEGANGISLDNMRIYQSLGTGVWIHNGSVGTMLQNTRVIRISNMIVEGAMVSGTTLGGDLVELGDPAGTAYNVAAILGRNMQLISPVLGYAALHVAGTSYGNTSNIDIEGSIGGEQANPGRGLQVEACQQCSFKFAGNSSYDYNLVVGSTSSAGTCVNSSIGAPGIIYDGEGVETAPGLTKCVDPATGVAAMIQTPTRMQLP